MPRKKKEKKEVCEIFEIEKKGKTKIEKACGEKESEPVTKSQVDSENKLLRNLLLSILGFIILLLLVVWFFTSINEFNYNGIKFKIVKEGNILFYNAVFPLYSERGKSMGVYNAYLRNDPRSLEKIPFNGEVAWKPLLVINSTEDFNCDGDGVIAIANLAQVLKTINTTIVKDHPNVTCTNPGDAMFVQLQSSNTTSIEKSARACYKINIADCEILKATERFLLEALSEINSRTGIIS